MVIFGVDPGTIVTGWGIIVGNNGSWSRLASGIHKCAASKPMSERLRLLESGLMGSLGIIEVDLMAIETQFVGRSPKTALAIGMARAVALIAAAKWEVNTVELEATRVKLCVAGHGHANKAQVADAVRRELGIRRRMDDNESDALAVALCAAKEMERAA